MTLYLNAPHNHSVNDSIPKEELSLHYTSVDDAFQYLLKFGVGAQMAKIDLKSAFRMVPVHPDNWELLGMQWRQKYHVDRCLPFGLRSAPFLFNRVASALEWSLINNYVWALYNLS